MFLRFAPQTLGKFGNTGKKSAYDDYDWLTFCRDQLDFVALTGYCSASGNVIMKYLAFVLGSCLIFVGVPSASCDVLNGSFESGFSDWTSVGPNSAVAALDGESPTDGGSMALLGNGRGSLSVAIQDIILSSSVGAPAGSIAGLFPGSTEGGIAFQTFNLDANQNGINFDWNFMTNESTPEPSFNDYAFASVWDSAGSLVSIATLDTFSAFPGAGSTYSSHTGWLSSSFGGLTPGGTYSLVFGVFDQGDFGIDSALLVDNVRGNVVPEPAGLSIVFGLALLAIRRRR